MEGRHVKLLTFIRSQRFIRFTTRDLAWTIVVASILFAYYRPNLSGTVKTGRELDVAVMGRGYLMVEHEGSHLSGFVRQGRLTLDQTGRLVWGNPSDGWIVQPQIIIPIDHTTIDVLHDGGVYYGQSSAGHLQQAGQLQVAVFMSEEHLNEIVPGVFG
jgi:flagellar basal body rod protein FlgG